MTETERVTFEQFLTKKKINVVLFATTNPKMFAHYAHIFEQVGAASFDHQTKFLLNDWRLDYPPKKD